MVSEKDKDIVVESLLINESMLHDMLVDYSELKDWQTTYKSDIIKLNRIRALLQELGAERSHTSTETWDAPSN